MRAATCALACLLALGAVAAAAQDSGKIAFESVTPTGYLALARGELGDKTMVFGTLRLPAANGPVPAMVIAHGSAGVTVEREFWWADQLAGIGVAGFVVDSFTPRHIVRTATDQSQLSTAANVADALAALRLLAADPRIDPQRIGVMGFSKGGQVALYTALEPFRRAIIAENTRFALHVPLYPYCNDWPVSEHITGAPLLFLLGGQDNYTPAAPCQDYAAWFRSKGAVASVIVYPNAYHDFDSANPPRYGRDLVTGRGCNGLIDLDRFTTSVRATGEPAPPDYFRKCLTRGAMAGGDGEAIRRAPDDVRAFVRTVFKLPGA
ncbi:MAG TPA: dienelactone hydrolase family protein [Candidatus Sulfotelmatobacter sp.]|nr:dienelactone hydrolase family protein [Candidatus Sulfotelmatobacter sp.]